VRQLQTTVLTALHVPANLSVYWASMTNKQIYDDFENKLANLLQELCLAGNQSFTNMEL
jgi:hypothetical protein